MDFFGHQEQARRATRRLVILYALSVLAIVGLLYVVAVIGLRSGRAYANSTDRLASGPIEWWQSDVLLFVSAAVLIVVGFGSLFKVGQLKSGGGVVAQMLGGARIAPNSKDELERRLINVVEEMAIASGMAVPEIYVLRNEQGINAFAAGWSPDDAAVAVTQGCLEQLTRDELQGVIAHEFSHVFHGDMRLNLRMVGILHGITCIAVGGSILLRVGFYSGSNRRRENGLPLVALAIALIVIGYIGVFFARLIKAAVSRQREFLADAAAAQYTRNPIALARALRRIGGHRFQSRVDHGRAEDLSHMFFANGLGRRLFAMFATHPPLEERVRRLDKAGMSAEPPKPFTEATHAARRAAAVERDRAGLDVGPIPVPTGGQDVVDILTNPAGAAAMASLSMTPEAFVDSIGEPQQEHVARARAILSSIPSALVQAAHDPYSARLLLCGMLLDERPDVRGVQLDLVEQHLGSGTRAGTVQWVDAVAKLPEAARLPLVELTLPALRQASAGQFGVLDRTLAGLIEADDEVTPFELALHKLVRKHLGGHFHPRPDRRPKYRQIAEVYDAARTLLSALAHAGQDESQAEAALRAADPVLRTSLQLAPRDQCGLDPVDRALTQLSESSGSIQRTFLLAAARVVAKDGQVLVAEGELVRAFAEALDCPMPPMAASADETGA